MGTSVTNVKVGYRLGITLGAATNPTTTQVSDYLSEAETTVEEIEPDASQNAKDTIIMKLVLKACEYYKKWQHADGAESGGDEHTGSWSHRSDYMLDWITPRDLDFLRRSAVRNSTDTVLVVGSFRRE